MARPYFTTRPRLTAFLIERGFAATQTVNVYDPTKKAWTFEDTPALRKAVDDYFAGEGEHSNGRRF